MELWNVGDRSLVSTQQRKPDVIAENPATLTK